MSATVERWGAVIAGGGPAGAAAACHLARAGKKTLLIEKEAHAHHKVCGEFLSFEAQAYLRELNVDPLKLGGVPLRSMRLFSGARGTRANLPFTALGLSRYVLDEQLLARAAACGVQIMRGHKVKKVVCAQALWHIEASGLEDLEAGAVFLATGKHDLGGLKRPPGRQNDFIGFKMHFTCTARKRQALNQHIDVVLFDGGYAGLQPIEGDKANLCLVIDKQHFARLGKRWNALLVYLDDHSPYLRAFLDEATPCWSRPAAIASLPYGYVYADTGERDDGIYRLGDQFAVIPSFSGEGISIALHTAKLAVDSLLHAGDTPASFYHRARSQLSSQIRLASLLGRTIENPAARSLGVASCRAFPPLLTYIAARTRIHAFGLDQATVPLCDIY
jgi:flavin-dependent dehydrogenase